MIASTPSAKAPRAAPANLRKEYSQFESQELLRTVMTEKFRRWLMKHALRWTEGDWQRSADLVQDAFLSLLRCKSYDPSKCRPTTYAYARLRGLFGKSSAKLQVKRSRFCRLETEPVSSELVTSPERAEIINRVANAIDTLSRRDAAIVRDFYDGVPLVETAQQFGVTRQAIHHRQDKALLALQDMKLPTLH